MDTTPIQQYVELVGGQTEAARRLGISRSLVGHMVNGRRGVSKRVAFAIERDTNGLFKKEQLVWPDHQAA